MLLRVVGQSIKKHHSSPFPPFSPRSQNAKVLAVAAVVPVVWGSTRFAIVGG
jgi:hypothetical protein